MIYVELFWSFLQVGLFAVGGGYASMPLIQAQVVEYHQWMTMSELIDVFALSQMTPGPIGINAATFVGARQAGIGGAIAATIGFVTPSIFIMLILGSIVSAYGNIGIIRGALNGLRVAVVALISSAGVLFVTLLLWGKEGVPKDLSGINIGALFLILCALYVLQVLKLDVIKTLGMFALLGVVFGRLGWL